MNEFDKEIDIGIGKALYMYQTLRFVADTPEEARRIVVNLLCYVCASIDDGNTPKDHFDFIMEYLMNLEENDFDGFMKLCRQTLIDEFGPNV